MTSLILGIFAPPFNQECRHESSSMPELPEVEITRRGLAARLTGQRIADVVVRDRRLRWPVSAELERQLIGATIAGIERRGKYLLFDCGHGYMLAHLGMSGSLRMVPVSTPAQKHDHLDLVLENALAMRLTDPRRFGAVLWLGTEPEKHPLLAGLGIEPLSAALSAQWLYAATRKAKVAMKLWLMNGHRITGIGNIYANEALFRAGVRPTRRAGSVTRRQCELLVPAIRETLYEAIEAGGSTLRNFVDSDGKPGYFQQQYVVYGRAGEPCVNCGTPIKMVRQGGRASYYCPTCQR
jgi:formamidopyrimidine-DNA glycosylase